MSSGPVSISNNIALTNTQGTNLSLEPVSIKTKHPYAALSLEELAEKIGILEKMIDLPAGSFWYGSTPEELKKVTADSLSLTPGDFRTSLPGFQAKMSAFQIAETETTQEQYAVVMLWLNKRLGLGLPLAPSQFHDPDDPSASFNLPAEQVSWGDGAVYLAGRSLMDKATAEKLQKGHARSGYANDLQYLIALVKMMAGEANSSREVATKPLVKAQEYMDFARQNPAYRLWVYPTEAEWEYAAEGGKGLPYAIPENRTPNNSINHIEKKTTPVKNYPPNPFGLFDMSGNVIEWCSSYYTERYPVESMDPKGPVAGKIKALRGGCYYSFAVQSTYVGNRDRSLPNIVSDSDIGFGFRAARAK